MSKTTFLSFPGLRRERLVERLTGRLGRLAEERESRKTLDARLKTSGMTYIFYVTFLMTALVKLKVEIHVSQILNS
jgi:hypothetical protein